MEGVTKTAEEQLSKARTIPGTRGFHQFVPMSENKIGAKRVSEQEKFSFEFSFCQEEEEVEVNPIIKARIGHFVVCKYDALYWIGMVMDIDEANQDTKVKFMHPNLPCSSLTWPRREDICLVPKMNVSLTIQPPTLSTATGRQYFIDKRDGANIEKLIVL